MVPLLFNSEISRVSLPHRKVVTYIFLFYFKEKEITVVVAMNTVYYFNADLTLIYIRLPLE